MVLSYGEDVEADLIGETRLLDDVAQSLGGGDRPPVGLGVISPKV